MVGGICHALLQDYEQKGAGGTEEELDLKRQIREEHEDAEGELAEGGVQSANGHIVPQKTGSKSEIQAQNKIPIKNRPRVDLQKNKQIKSIPLKFQHSSNQQQ